LVPPVASQAFGPATSTVCDRPACTGGETSVNRASIDWTASIGPKSQETSEVPSVAVVVRAVPLPLTDPPPEATVQSIAALGTTTTFPPQLTSARMIRGLSLTNALDEDRVSK
jgi:hypothetical protein